MDRDEPYTAEPVHGWFKPAAIGSVLFMLMGCAAYLFEVTVDPATLPADQRAISDAAPTWMMFFFAVAVWVGLAGAVLLLMRRRIGETLLLVSLIAVIIQFSAYFIDPELREAMPADGMLIPILILLATWTIYWFARHSRQRGWLK